MSSFPRASRLAVLAPILLAACNTRTPPPPGAPGDVIYELQNCANCHGPAGEGTDRGPALSALGEHWTADRLAAFLEAPDDSLDQDARLRGLEQAFPGKMSRYDNLNFEQRLVLSNWLLAR